MTRFGTFFEMGGRGAMECLTRTGHDKDVQEFRRTLSQNE